MSHWAINHAWKDQAYRLSLSDAARTQLPVHPVGLIKLVEREVMGALEPTPTRMANVQRP